MGKSLPIKGSMLQAQQHSLMLECLKPSSRSTVVVKMYEKVTPDQDLSISQILHSSSKVLRKPVGKPTTHTLQHAEADCFQQNICKSLIRFLLNLVSQTRPLRPLSEGGKESGHCSQSFLTVAGMYAAPIRWSNL